MKFNVVSSKAGAISRSHIITFSLLAIISIFLLTAPLCHAAQVTLAWDPNPEPTVSGYRVYYGTSSYYYSSVIDVGNRTDCTITGLLSGVTYVISATAYSSRGDESNFSDAIAYTVPGDSPTPSPSPSPSGSSGGGCFIATAAYGSYLAPEVATLREFRDRYLLTNSPGQAFVEWYYRASPPVAAFIAEHESLKSAVRLGLTPLVYAVKYPAAAAAVLLLIPVAVIVRKRRAAAPQWQE
jgi:hypothetical protein